MSLFLRIATAANRIGLGSLVARAASLKYPASRFSVDREGRWVNCQEDGTFVSPTVHTASYAAVKGWVLDNWTWGYRPGPGDTVIDVGAGIGEEAVIFSELVGDNGRVIAVEAHPGTFKALEETVRRSRLTNVTAMFCAVADRDGELEIGDGDAHLANSVIGQGSGVRVPARSIDSLAAELGIAEVALLKMNIEGAERLAVDGMAQIAPKVRNLVISCHDFIATENGGSPEFRTKDHVRKALKRLGFVISSRSDAATSWMRDYLYGQREDAPRPRKRKAK